MKKTKLLFLARRYSPHIGGVETHVEHLSAILQKKNYEITLITERHDSALSGQENIGNVQVQRIALPRAKTNKWSIWWWMLRHTFLFLRTDIIHIHDVFFWILPIYPLLKLSGKKIYVTFHGYEAPGPLTKKQIFWHRLAARLTKGNICVGGFHKKYYGVFPNFITYGGVDAVSPQKIKKKEKAIIFVGRLSPDTGILKYLEAVKLLAEQNESYHLDIFGDGELRRQCEKFVEIHNLDVSFHGFVPNATQYFREYQTVFTSQYLSILAAMVNSCTVISYADTAIKNDYLRLTPFANWIAITQSAQEITTAVIVPKPMHKHGVGWAKKQTWTKLENEYLDLWKQ